MSMEQAFQTYLVESRERLAEMEQLLLGLEQTGATPSIVNDIFRAVHTIKGSAGLFALDDIVAFSHVVESLLDRLRREELAMTDELCNLLLACGDHIGELVNNAEARRPESTPEQKAESERLLRRLNVFMETPKDGAAGAVPPAAAAPTAGERAATPHWHLSLRFGPNVLRVGLDPLGFLRALEDIGRIVHREAVLDSLPAWAELDPEANYLGYELSLESSATAEAIDKVFEWVAAEAQIRVLPPHSPLQDYAALVTSAAEGTSRMSDWLVACGTLTAAERAAILAPESSESVEAEAASPAVRASDAPEPIAGAKAKDKPGIETKVVRVEASKLDQLINLVGELVIAGAGAQLLAQRTAHEDVAESTAVVARLIERVRDAALSLRMVQIGSVFTRFQRVVHDVSREMGKDIELVISGADTELDKTMVEKITDPLLHLVRNAIDHGIEPADVRVARGKPARGHIHLNAYHDAGSIVIEVSDDGGGLNRDKILAKAIERKLVGSTQTLSDREIYQLIFEPGFSTADTVTNLSGRGVGMDVVRRNIAAIRGTIDLESEAGRSATCRMRLPLTLAIIDGFLVGVGQTRYVIPLDMVLECVELSRTEYEASDRRNYINLRGHPLPFIRLRDLFGLQGSARRRENLVVTHYDGQKAGLVVDELLGESQTVIKPLGKLFSRLRGIGGSTILGSGEVALILDVPGLVRKALSDEAHAFADDANAHLATAPGAAAPETPPGGRPPAHAERARPPPA